MPTLPIPGAPTDPRATAFRALVAALKKHPRLRAIVKTWRAWEGNPRDAHPESSGTLPEIRLTPLNAPAVKVSTGIAGRSCHKTPIRVVIETWVPPFHADNPANLWGQLFAAIFKADADGQAEVRAELSAAGIRDVLLRKPALPQTQADYGTAAIRSEGEIELTLFVAG